MNDKIIDLVMKAVSDSYNGELMPIGDEVTVVLKDSSVLVKMESINGERHLSVSVSPEKPIMLTHYKLFEDEKSF